MGHLILRLQSTLVCPVHYRLIMRVQPCVWCIFCTNRNCISLSFYLAHYPIRDKSLYWHYDSKCLLLLKLPLKVQQFNPIKWCQVISQRYFSKGDFPCGNFPNVQFPKRQLPKSQVRPSDAPQAAIGGRALRLGWAMGLSSEARTGLGAEHCGLDRFGKLPLGKLHIWKVDTWENTLGKTSLGKYLTF